MSRHSMRELCLAGAFALLCADASSQDCIERFDRPTTHDGARRLIALEGPGQGLYGIRVYDLEAGSSDWFARWTGATWQSMGPFPGLRLAGSDREVWDLCVFDDGTGPAIYGCGIFDSNELGEPLRSVAKWNGEKWVDVGGGVNGSCRALCVFDDGAGPALYVGGYIIEAGGRFVSNIARWDGDVWSDVGGGVAGGNNWVYALGVFDDGSGPALFVGGEFHTAAGEESPGIAKWTGAEWVPIGARVQGPWGGSSQVNDMIVHDDGSGPQLYIVGAFGAIAGLRAQGIARWDGTAWSNVGDTAGSLFRTVYALGAFDDGTGPKLYAGGNLSDWFGHPASLARWDGAEWEDMSTVSGVLLGPRTLATLQTPQGEELWLGTPLGRLRCVSDSCDFADCDHSGRLDFFDFLCYQDLFAAADPAADCDGSGDLTFLDFLCFQNHFAAGCP